MVFQYAVVNWAWLCTHHHARSLERIFGEEDVEVLKRWHKAAAKADSIEEFLNVM